MRDCSDAGSGIVFCAVRQNRFEQILVLFHDVRQTSVCRASPTRSSSPDYDKLKFVGRPAVNSIIIRRRGSQRRMKQYNLCFLGFGNVGRALARLFALKSAELRELYGIEWRITGVATRRMGWLANAEGFKIETLLGGDTMQPET